MVRLAVMIVFLTAIAVGLVQIRRSEATVRYQTQQLKLRQVSLSRRLWDQQTTLGQLTRPASLRRRADEMALGLSDGGVVEEAAHAQPPDRQ